MKDGEINIGIIVFAYNRSRHITEVLEGLRKNQGVEKLYVYQDGLKCEKHFIEWEKTSRVITEIDWCEVIYRRQEYNKGLAKSIIDGVTEVFEENDAVIVLEDDCVPTANFIHFMRQCFEKFRNDKRVYSVSGYNWPINLKRDKYDIYGCGRISSWGWGTWKDRWDCYHIDNNILKHMKKDADSSRALSAWGSDLETTLLANISGQADSWAVYWALHVIDKRGICINPYESFIQNIGMDGTGVHCGISNRFQVELEKGEKTEFVLPQRLEVLQTTEMAFASLYGSYTAVNATKENAPDVLVYGLGNFFTQYEREINSVYRIRAFIDQRKKGWYAGKAIININEIPEYTYDKIIIMVADIQEILNIIKKLIKRDVCTEKLLLGHMFYGQYSKMIDKIRILSEGRLLLDFGRISITIDSKSAFNMAYEIFAKRIYNYYINNSQLDIVFDIGMDMKYSVRYFAGMNKVKKVYALNISEGESQESIVAEDKVSIIDCRGKKMEKVMEQILARYPDHNVILKMNNVGIEYSIAEELCHSGILKKFSLIIIKYQCRDKEIWEKYLMQVGFSLRCADNMADQGVGMIYAY